MKIKIVIVGLLLTGILVGGVYYWLKIDQSKTVVTDKSNIPKYSSKNLGLAFDYPVGPNGYVLEEITPSQTDSLVKTLVLKTTEDASRKPLEGSEGAPTITINVFKNTKKQFPSVWVRENAQYSNFSLVKGATQEAVVGGANAVKYEATGLYESLNYVVAHGDYIYQFVGMYSIQDSAIFRDFEPIVATVNFIPTDSQQ